WKSCRDAILPRERNCRGAERGAACRRLRRATRAWRGRLRGVNALYEWKSGGALKGLSVRAVNHLGHSFASTIQRFNASTFLATASASGASASIFPANRFVI